MVIRREKISFYTHFFAAVLAAGAGVFLCIKSADIPYARIISLIYAISTVFVFSASALYHAKKRKENDQSIWRKIDHFAIFVMIAGSYTPMCFAYLEGNIKYAVLAIQWGLVVTGAVFKFGFLRAPRFISTVIYLAMGWMIIFLSKSFFSNMPFTQFAFLLAGGLAYTVGAVLYALKKPALVPNFFGFHEIFHILIIVGAGLHYVVMFRAMS